jgi:hypothetical protein
MSLPKEILQSIGQLANQPFSYAKSKGLLSLGNRWSGVARSAARKSIREHHRRARSQFFCGHLAVVR